MGLDGVIAFQLIFIAATNCSTIALTTPRRLPRRSISMLIDPASKPTIHPDSTRNLFLNQILFFFIYLLFFSFLFLFVCFWKLEPSFDVGSHRPSSDWAVSNQSSIHSVASLGVCSDPLRIGSMGNHSVILTGCEALELAWHPVVIIQSSHYFARRPWDAV